jgi:hypothetical protein
MNWLIRTIKHWFDKAADHYTGASQLKVENESLRHENEALKAQNQQLLDRVHYLEKDHKGIHFSVVLLTALLAISATLNIVYWFFKH